jgi:hypothetical protein
MLLAVYAIPLVVTLRPIGDPVFEPDVWWHLRVGQWVVEHGSVPSLAEPDPFSQVGKPWVAYSWLYEVLLYGLFQAFGLAGIVVYRVALALAIVFALHRFVARREPRFLIATSLTAAAVLCVAMIFSERPWLFTVLFSILTLEVVLDLRQGKRGWLFWLLPLLFVLWANIHIQFVYGLLLLGLGCLAPLLDHYRGRKEGETSAAPPWQQPTWRQLAGLTVACTVATLINPWHVRLYGVVLEYAVQPGPFRFVNELKALEFREPCDWVVLSLLAAAVYLVGRRNPPSSFDYLLLALAGVLTFRARRDLWLGCLAALAVLTEIPPRQVPEGDRFPLSPLRYALLGLGLLLVGWATVRVRDLSPANLERKVAESFPVEAARVVRERGYAGPLFNDFNWGGYLIWSLPGLPVAIDGRTNLQGDERIIRFGRTWSGAAPEAGNPGWRDDADLKQAGVVIAPLNTPLAELLLYDREQFELVHEDPVARVFVRRKPANP